RFAPSLTQDAGSKQVARKPSRFRAGCPKSRGFSRDLLASGVLRERRRESGRWSSCWFTHRTRLSASCCCTLCSFYRLRAPWGGGAKSCNSSARVVIFRKLLDGKSVV